MGFYEKYFLPKLVHYTCGLKPLMKQREKVVPLAEGKVLEIGIGSGLNLPFYTPERVQHVWGLDPSPEMLELTKKNLGEIGFGLDLIEAGAEKIPLDDNTVDTALITYTLCTVPDALPALFEIKRVLKHNGQLIFCEHGKAPDENVMRWQERLNPAWRRFSGGCNLNRDIPSLILEAGFRIQTVETMYLPAFKPASFNYWGTAVPGQGGS